MTSTSKIQVSGRVGETIVVIGADSVADFQDNVLAILGEDGAATVADTFRAAFVNGAEIAIMNKAATAVMEAGMAAPTPAQAATTTPQVPSSPPADAVREETDKWGSHWTYQIPGAPTCAHGATVQKRAISKAGKPYTMWSCPTATPFAFRNKVAKADCDGAGFAR